MKTSVHGLAFEIIMRAALVVCAMGPVLVFGGQGSVWHVPFSTKQTRAQTVVVQLSAISWVVVFAIGIWLGLGRVLLCRSA